MIHGGQLTAPTFGFWSLAGGGPKGRRFILKTCTSFSDFLGFSLASICFSACLLPNMTQYQTTST